MNKNNTYFPLSTSSYLESNAFCTCRKSCGFGLRYMPFGYFPLSTYNSFALYESRCGNVVINLGDLACLGWLLMLGKWNIVSGKLLFFFPPLFFLHSPWWFFWKAQRCIQFITEIRRLYCPRVNFHFRLGRLQDTFFPVGAEILGGILPPFCSVPASAFLGLKVP